LGSIVATGAAANCGKYSPRMPMLCTAALPSIASYTSSAAVLVSVASKSSPGETESPHPASANTASAVSARRLRDIRE
jgi:hypothetical protein